VRSSVLVLRRAPLVSFKNSRHSALVFGPYVKHIGRSNNFNHQHAHLARRWIFIYTARQLRACKCLHSFPGKLCCLRSRRLPCIIYLNSVRTTTLNRRDANNIQGIYVWLPRLVRAFFLWAKWSDVPISTCYSRQDCLLRLVFKSYTTDTTYCELSHFAMESPVVNNWGGLPRIFRTGPLPEVRAQSLTTRATTNARSGLI